MKRLAQELPVNIAVSLNASTEEQRRTVMPITKRYSMGELMQACRDLPLPNGKRITFEYVMMEGQCQSRGCPAIGRPDAGRPREGQPDSVQRKSRPRDRRPPLKK